MARLDSISPAKYRCAERFAKVQAALVERARRLEYLRAELLAEPAWDILLELIQHRVTVPDLTGYRDTATSFPASKGT